MPRYEQEGILPFFLQKLLRNTVYDKSAATWLTWQRCWSRWKDESHLQLVAKRPQPTQKVLMVFHWWAGGIGKHAMRDSSDGINLHMLPVTLVF